MLRSLLSKIMPQPLQRLPEVKDLYSILPRGTEGGKEFARIVDLLLFHDARRSGKTFSLFSDVAGDYHGLDSFEVGRFRQQEQIGYQYKFYPCPLSPKHRRDIEHSLSIAQQRNKALGLKKWRLVTPQDFVESATREDGGDVTWFENLRAKISEFDIEHWGHRNLNLLFLETPLLCLRYYPELVDQGIARKRTIEDTRSRYDKTLTSLYREILFVGIPVYKQETARGIPMQDIYIPLSVLPEPSGDKGRSNRIDPTTLLVPGRRQVILGDPGTGKSTLLRFMALSGSSRPLQQRYKVKRDKRLPLLITLRRYADELKTRENLALLDYAAEVLGADLSLNSIDRDFLEFYLETGQSILLLDGLDELPNPSFKQIVRDRIRTFAEVYPGNTIVVTSRIVGYEDPFRFSAQEFHHFTVAKLETDQIEQFIRDWYRARIDNKAERDRNAKDLVRIVNDSDHSAIHELAENPLLLTIVALVHRIDAVLPDERVVLYQKCTETLLNTWHTWKYRELEVKNRGKVERRNRSRMEAIAYWMQCRSVTAERDSRTVVPYSELHGFLKDYIDSKEHSSELDRDSSDSAHEFLDFIKKRAGLLIEVGDARYSFVHLTFQEYLTSTYLVNTNEVDGAPGMWKALDSVSGNPKWHEVTRLLVAGLRSNESQDYLIEKILHKHKDDRTVTTAQLLGGLLLDGIDAAEQRREEFLARMVAASCVKVALPELRVLLGNIETFIAKQPGTAPVLWKAFEQALELYSATERTAAVLIAALFGTPRKQLENMAALGIPNETHVKIYKKLVLHEDLAISPTFDRLSVRFSALSRWQRVWALRSPSSNLMSAALLSITALHSEELFWKVSFYLQLATLGAGSGPYHDFTRNWLELFFANIPGAYIEAIRGSTKHDVTLRKRLEAWSKLTRLETKFGTQKVNHRLDAKIRELRSQEMEGLDVLRSPRPRFRRHGTSTEAWELIMNGPQYYQILLDQICDVFRLTPKTHWWEVLKRTFIPTLATSQPLINLAELDSAVLARKATRDHSWRIASLLLLDVWHATHAATARPRFETLLQTGGESTSEPVWLASCIWKLAFGQDSQRNRHEVEDLLGQPSIKDLLLGDMLPEPSDKKAEGGKPEGEIDLSWDEDEPS
jgi:NACHT domain